MAQLVTSNFGKARYLTDRIRRVVRRVEHRIEMERSKGPQRSPDNIDWVIDELMYFRGRGFISGSIGIGSELSPTRVQLMSLNGRVLSGQPLNVTLEGRLPFRMEVAIEDPIQLREGSLRVLFGDRSYIEVSHLVHPKIGNDPYHRLTNRFFAECSERGRENPESKVLEIGSRARSGHVRRELVAPMNYLGLDILPGENTDVVGDAHNLSAQVEPESFDAVFSISTFEHLAMPWKAVLEINKVLKLGGRVLISSHQTFPLHEQPWDFWRFSDMAWHALFNEATGFKIVETAFGEGASIVADLLHEVTTTLEFQPAYLGSVVLAEKVGGTDLTWPVDVVQLTETMYPQ